VFRDVAAPCSRLPLLTQEREYLGLPPALAGPAEANWIATAFEGPVAVVPVEAFGVDLQTQWSFLLPSPPAKRFDIFLLRPYGSLVFGVVFGNGGGA
jgi:hypothetical protein